MIGDSPSILGTAAELVYEIEQARAVANNLPEGALLDVYDRDILSIGEALLIDGCPTREANMIMLDCLEERHSRKVFALTRERIITSVPGYQHSRLLKEVIRMLGLI